MRYNIETELVEFKIDWMQKYREARREDKVEYPRNK